MGFLVKSAELVEKGVTAGQESGIVSKTRDFIGGALNMVGNFIQTTPEPTEEDQDVT
jgi:hypothetical protein